MQIPSRHADACDQCALSYEMHTISVNDVEVLIIDSGDVIDVVPRGTEATPLGEHLKRKKDGIKDWWRDFTLFCADFTDVIRDLRFWPVGYYGMRGHAGFLRGAAAVESELLRVLPKDKPIRLRGHSLGGGLSIPTGGMLDQNGYTVLEIVTFGCPLVLSKGHELFDHIPIYQYEYANDAVPTYQQFWSTRKHFNRIMIGKPRSKNWFRDRTWDPDHWIPTYQGAARDGNVYE